MAATVKFPNARTKDYEEGRDAQVKDGHLFIFDGRQSSSPNIIAVYAPGAWIAVDVTTS